MTYPPFLTSSLWLGLRAIKDPALALGREKPRNQCPGKKITNSEEDRESDRTGWTHLVEQGIIMLEAPPVPLPSACLLVRTPRRSRSRRWHWSLIWALLLWVCLGSRWRLLRVRRQNAVVLRKAGHEEVLRRGLGGPLAHPRSLCGPVRAREAARSRASQALNWEQWIRGFLCSSFKNSHRRLRHFSDGNLVQGNR